MKKNIVKTLNFDEESPEQMEVYNFLEKIRYYQTRLMCKLILSFMKENGIDENTPYQNIKLIVDMYLKDIKILKGEVSSDNEINTLLKAFLASSISMQNTSVQQVPLPPPVKDVQLEHNLSVPKKESEKQTAILSEPMDLTVDEDDDISTMSSGFANMLQ